MPNDPRTTQQRVVGFLYRYDVEYLELLSGVGAALSAAGLVAAQTSSSFHSDLRDMLAALWLPLPLLAAVVLLTIGMIQVTGVLGRFHLWRVLGATGGAAAWLMLGTLSLISGVGIVAASVMVLISAACALSYIRLAPRL